MLQCKQNLMLPRMEFWEKLIHKDKCYGTNHQILIIRVINNGPRKRVEEFLMHHYACE